MVADLPYDPDVSLDFEVSTEQALRFAHTTNEHLRNQLAEAQQNYHACEQALDEKNAQFAEAKVKNSKYLGQAMESHTRAVQVEVQLAEAQAALEAERTVREQAERERDEARLDQSIANSLAQAEQKRADAAETRAADLQRQLDEAMQVLSHRVEADRLSEANQRITELEEDFDENGLIEQVADLQGQIKLAENSCRELLPDFDSDSRDGYCHNDYIRQAIEHAQIEANQRIAELEAEIIKQRNEEIRVLEIALSKDEDKDARIADQAQKLLDVVNALASAGIDMGTEEKPTDECEAVELLTKRMLNTERGAADARVLASGLRVKNEKLWALVKLGVELANAQALYCTVHDLKGNDAPTTGAKWDVMRRAGDAFRAAYYTYVKLPAPANPKEEGL